MSSPISEPGINYADLAKVPSLAKVPGTLMGLTFIVFLPLGALIIRIFRYKYGVWVHAPWRLVTLAFMLASLATRTRVGKTLNILHKNAHTIIGTVIVAALLLQPFLGYIHHRKYKARSHRIAWTHLHIWCGRLRIILVIASGGLGLHLVPGTPSYSKSGIVVYSVLAGVSGIMLLSLIGFVTVRKDITIFKSET